MSNAENLSDTIKPKSDQLNADDLLTATITVKVTSVTRGPKDQPVSIGITGQQPYKPCKSMRRVLIACWGDNGHEWVGRSMTLYCDPSVKYGGVAMGGIRISHLSDIESKVSLMLTTTRARRAQFDVLPLVVTYYPADKFESSLAAMKSAIESGKSNVAEIVVHLEKTAPVSAEQLAYLSEIKGPEA